MFGRFLFIWYISILIWIKSVLAWVGSKFPLMMKQPFGKSRILEVIDVESKKDLTCQFCWVFHYQPHTVQTLKTYFPQKISVKFRTNSKGVEELWVLDGTEYYTYEGDKHKFSFKKIKP